MSQCSNPLTPILLPNVAQGNRKTASDWNTIWNIGYRAGREKTELEHAEELIRLEGRIQLWRDVAFVAGTTAVAAIIIIANTLIH